MEKYLTYDDVQLLPANVSKIRHRSDVSLTTVLVNNGIDKIEINIPIVSSPMDTVTWEEMIKALSKYNTIGFLHRFNMHVDLIYTLKNLKSNLKDFPLCASFGLNNTVNDIIEMYSSGARVFLLDVANGHNLNVIKHFVNIKSQFYHIKKLVKENKAMVKHMTAFHCSNFPPAFFVLGNFSDSFPNIEWFKDDNEIYQLPDAIRIGIGGGCFTPNMLVHTKNGYKRICDIKINDYVYTHTGKLQKVIDIINYNNNENIIEINGIECTENHEFYVVHKNNINKINENNIHEYAQWIKANELTDEYQLIELES